MNMVFKNCMLILGLNKLIIISCSSFILKLSMFWNSSVKRHSALMHATNVRFMVWTLIFEMEK